MRRRSIIFFAIISVLSAVGILAASPRIHFCMLTGRFSPIQKIETLQNPVAVTKWSSEGLILADGRTVQLPGFRTLPGQSPALLEATKRGAEIQPDGRIWGLVTVHHWCGNDPVRKHIARVDISEMMTFLREGESVVPVSGPQFLNQKPGGTFSEWGWDIGEFSQFRAWQNIRNTAK